MAFIQNICFWLQVLSYLHIKTMAYIISEMPIILLLIPLISSLGLYALRNQIKHQYTGILACASTCIGFLMSIFVSFEPNVFISYQWFSVANYHFTIDFWLNNHTCLILILVQFIGLLVQIYSMAYMEPYEFSKYFAFIQFFIFSMLGIILAGNLMQIFFFWELVGFASYLLIGFWYEKETAVRANQKAFLMNRVGDAGFLLGILLVFKHFGTFQLPEIIQKANFLIGGALSSCPPSWEKFTNISYTSPENYISLTIMGLCLFGGTIGKSAQFPLQSWLPDAMEGPTPVSALIHAATMVAAGVFLLVRIFPILTPDALFVISIVGTITMILGASKALFQTDIKKLLAYSTISQLGFMVLAIGVGSPNAALFHLTTHAFFKAGLFLCAGAIIHAIHEQDVNKIAGLKKSLPVVFYTYTIFAAALAGLPFFTGFLSKDAILISIADWAAFKGSFGFMVLGIVLLSSILTATYMTKQFKGLFFGENKHQDIHYPNWQIQLPLVILAVLSLGFVFAINPFSVESVWFFDVFKHNINEKWHFMGYIGTTCALLGCYLGWSFGFSNLSIFKPSKDIYTFCSKKIIQSSIFIRKFDEQIIDGIVNGFATLQLFLADLSAWIDRNIVDGFVNSFANSLKKIGSYTRQIQSGQIQHYIAYLFVGILLLILLFV